MILDVLLLITIIVYTPTGFIPHASDGSQNRDHRFVTVPAIYTRHIINIIINHNTIQVYMYNT